MRVSFCGRRHRIREASRSVARWPIAAGSVAIACGPLAGVEEKPCRPGCVDDRTQLVCNAGGVAESRPCPEPTAPCAESVCTSGTCAKRPAVGRACGPRHLARCNEGYACLGPDLKLTAGWNHTCALADDGEVWCWGMNDHMQLGDGTYAPDRGNPVRVVGLPGPAIAISGGASHSCAIVAGGDAYCWGHNDFGRAVPSTSDDPVRRPSLVSAGGVHFSDIRAAGAHTCALATDGTVFCWGANHAGQCGVDPQNGRVVKVDPHRIANVDQVTSIESVKNHACAVRSAAPSLVCWGENKYSDLGGQSFIADKLGPNAAGREYSATPVAVDFPGYQVRNVGMGHDTTYAIVTNGKVYAFGLNADSRLGTGSKDRVVSTPDTVKYRGMQDFVMDLSDVYEIVRSGSTDQCAWMEDLRYLCWGTDKNGELGLDSIGQTLIYATPTSVLPPTAKNMVHGEAHVCVSARAGEGSHEHTEIWCYGNGARVGNGSTDPNKNQLEAAPIVWKP